VVKLKKNYKFIKCFKKYWRIELEMKNQLKELERKPTKKDK